MSWQSTRSKAKLGAEPFRMLFARVAGPAGTRATPGAFWRRLRVTTVDGFTLDVPDTAENSAFFGRGKNGSDTPNPYPQLRGLALAEAGTRSLLAGACRPFRTGEQALAPDLLPAMGTGMVVLADRNLASWRLWRDAAATGAQLCWRMSASFTLPVTGVLPDGTYLSQLRPPRKKDGDPIRIRVIEYAVTAAGEDGTETSELFALGTTLLDPAAYPAGALALLYHDRWQAPASAT